VAALEWQEGAPSPFSKVLVANRGEIACRVIRACRELGLETVAVHSRGDANALHVELADEAVLLEGDLSATYLSIGAIMRACVATGAEAVHPGYGFLSERAEFAHVVEAAGIVWVGPPASAIESMGDKVAARRLMRPRAWPSYLFTGRDRPLRLLGLGEVKGARGICPGGIYALLGMRCYMHLREDEAGGDPPEGETPIAACAAFRRRWELEPVLEHAVPNRFDLAFPMYPLGERLTVGLYRVGAPR